MTPDLLADLELFPRDQGGLDYRIHSPSHFLMVHYLRQMVHLLFTSTHFLQAQAVQAQDNLHNSHLHNNSSNNSSNNLRLLVLLELVRLVRGVFRRVAVLVVIHLGPHLGLGPEALAAPAVNHSHFLVRSPDLDPSLCQLVLPLRLCHRLLHHLHRTQQKALRVQNQRTLTRRKRSM